MTLPTLREMAILVFIGSVVFCVLMYPYMRYPGTKRIALTVRRLLIVATIIMAGALAVVIFSPAP